MFVTNTIVGRNNGILGFGPTMALHPPQIRDSTDFSFLSKLRCFPPSIVPHTSHLTPHTSPAGHLKKPTQPPMSACWKNRFMKASNVDLAVDVVLSFYFPALGSDPDPKKCKLFQNHFFSCPKVLYLALKLEISNLCMGRGGRVCVRV